MSQTFKQLIAVVIAIIMIVMIYFGSYLPLRKGQILIDVMHNLGSVRTIDDLEKVLSAPLDFYSPVGHDESVRQVGNIILGILTNQKSLPQEATNELINFTLKYFNPIINSGHGGNFSQNFLILGQMYRVAGLNYNNSAYLDKAVEYYKQGLIYSPNRPQFLYGLFEVYYRRGNFVEAKKVGEEILKYWPSDNKIREVISKIN